MSELLKPFDEDPAQDLAHDANLDGEPDDHQQTAPQPGDTPGAGDPPKPSDTDQTG